MATKFGCLRCGGTDSDVCGEWCAACQAKHAEMIQRQIASGWPRGVRVEFASENEDAQATERDDRWHADPEERRI